MDGLLIIDKPGGVTSHDVVQRTRKLLKTSRVGHLGTLDPMATGVLLLCVGRATRIGRFLTTSPKEYVGEIRFGFATSTYDREGELAGIISSNTPQRSDVEQVMTELTGTYSQKPPRISAKKLGGIPSYKLARRGIDIEPVAVDVEVSVFEVTDFNPPLARFRAVCSSGTYVRSLAHDLGQKLGCGAHLDSLRRVRSGDFSIDDAVAPGEGLADRLVRLEDLLAGLPRIDIEDELQEDRVRHGNPVETSLSTGLARIFNKKGQFLAVAAIENGWAHPRVVLTSGTSVEPRKALLRPDTEQESRIGVHESNEGN